MTTARPATPDPSVEISPATQADLTDLVALHRVSFKGFPSTRFGNRYARTLVGFFADNPDAFALMARDTGSRALLGYVLGVWEHRLDTLDALIVPAAARAVALRPWLVFDRSILVRVLAQLKIIRGPSPHPHADVPRPTIGLSAIGTAPEARGRGVGRALMDGFEAVARERNAGSMALSVYPINAAARRLYEAVGWEPGPEPGDPKTSMTYTKALRVGGAEGEEGA